MHRFYIHHSFTKFHRNVSLQIYLIYLIFSVLCTITIKSFYYSIVNVTFDLFTDHISNGVIFGCKSGGAAEKARACD